MVAKRCKNVSHNSGITVYAQCQPCPMYSSATHEVKIRNERRREIEGDITSTVKHRFAMFHEKGQTVDRVTKHVVTRNLDFMAKKLIQGSQRKGQETVKTDFSYWDETEKLLGLVSPHYIYVNYWVDVI